MFSYHDMHSHLLIPSCLRLRLALLSPVRSSSNSLSALLSIIAGPWHLFWENCRHAVPASFNLVRITPVALVLPPPSSWSEKDPVDLLASVTCVPEYQHSVPSLPSGSFPSKQAHVLSPSPPSTPTSLQSLSLSRILLRLSWPSLTTPRLSQCALTEM